MNFESYTEYLQNAATSLLSIDSASGFTTKATDYLLQVVEELGYPVYRNNIGNVIVTVEGEDDTEPVALSAHVDTLGLMVHYLGRTADDHAGRRTVAAFSGGGVLQYSHERRQSVYRHDFVFVPFGACV